MQFNGLAIGYASLTRPCATCCWCAPARVRWGNKVQYFFNGLAIGYAPLTSAMCNLPLVRPNKRTLGRKRVQHVSVGWLLLRLRAFDQAVRNLLLVRFSKLRLGRKNVH